MITLHVKAQFLQPVLGTASNNPTIFSDYNASLAPDAVKKQEEIEMLGAGEYTDKNTTVFLRNDDGEPVVIDYQIKGFFKDACSMMRRVKGSESEKMKAYKKIIDGTIFVYPRFIPIKFEGDIDYKERPLRAQTPQGERICLASSEMIPEDSEIEFDVECLNDGDKKAVIEWLDYGAKRGLLQWRNAGYGRFAYTYTEEKS